MRFLVLLKGILDLNWLGMANVDLPTTFFHSLAWWAVCGAWRGACSWLLDSGAFAVCDSGEVTCFSGPQSASLKVDGLDYMYSLGPSKQKFSFAIELCEFRKV